MVFTITKTIDTKEVERPQKKVKNFSTKVGNFEPKKPKIKIDWIAFTVPESCDFNFNLLSYLGYDLKDFDETLGRNYFNSGYNFNNAIKVYYNDPKKPINEKNNTTGLHQYTFTGVGCTHLQQMLKDAKRTWLDLFKYLDGLRVQYSRVDLALDDMNYPSLIDFKYIEGKLNRREFRSSNRKYNIIKNRNTSGAVEGETCYWGTRNTTGKNGHVLCRCYDKALQMIKVKHQQSQLPEDVKDQIYHPDFDDDYRWMRWELEFTKMKATSVIRLILINEARGSKHPIAETYYSQLRDVVEFLVPQKTKNGKLKPKSRWPVTPKWKRFLNDTKRAHLENAEQVFDIGKIHDWVCYQVMPTIQMLQTLYEAKGLDFYRVMKQVPELELSKKQKFLLHESLRDLSRLDLEGYAQHFVEDRGGEYTS